MSPSRSAAPRRLRVSRLAPDASPAFIISGYELPPELTPERWLTEWRPDWLWVAVAVFGLVAYILGLVKVLRRGDSWSWPRTVNWVIGLGVLTYVTSGPPAVYGRVLFSAHMVDHMALTMVAPSSLSSAPRPARAPRAHARDGTAPAAPGNGCSSSSTPCPPN